MKTVTFCLKNARSAKPMSFCIYPGPARGRTRFRVRVYSTRRAMLRAIRREGWLPRKGINSTQALCVAVLYAHYDRRAHWFSGELFFHRGDVSIRTVSHEIQHAVLELAGWRGLLADRKHLGPGVFMDDARAEDEAICEMSAELHAQFHAQAFKRGLWK